MRTALRLTKWYHRAHRRHFAANTACIVLFLCALQLSLMIRDGVLCAMEQSAFETYGSYTEVLYHVNPDALLQSREAIASSGSGVVSVTARIQTEESSVPLCLGTMDKNALSLKSIRLEQGRLPQGAKEAAIEHSACLALSVSAVPGETITLPLRMEDGSVEETQFVLTGILHDYIADWKRFDPSGCSLSSPPPAVLVGESEFPILYTHVLCNAVSFPDDLGGERAENYYHPSRGNGLHDGRLVADLITLPLSGAFLIAACFGISGVVRRAADVLTPFLRSLRLAGASRKLAKRTALLTLFSQLFWGLAFGTACSLLACYLLSPLLCAWGIGYLPAPSPISLLLPPAAITLAFAVSCALTLRRVLPANPLHNNAVPSHSLKRRRQTPRSLWQLWRPAVKRQYFAQNFLTALLAAFCMLFAVGGSFFAQFAPRVDNPSAALGSTERDDFKLFVTSGSSGPPHFYITLPRNMGISAQNLEKIRETKGLRVTNAYIRGMTSHLLLQREGDDNPYLSALREADCVFSQEGAKTDELRTLLDAQPGDTLLVPFLRGMDEESVRFLFPRLTAGTLSPEAFRAGEELLAPDGLCSVGDELLLITPLLMEGDPKQDQSRNITFDIRTVRVGATYPSESISDPLILSAEFIFALDPSCRYEYVGMEILPDADPGDLEAARSLLTEIAARSDNVSVRDLGEEQAVFKASIRSKTLGILAAVSVFLLMLLAAFTLSSYVRVKTNFRSYLLMRAVGAGGRDIRRLLLRENRRPTFTGCFLGLLAGLALMFVCHLKFNHLPVWDIVVFTVLPVSAVTAALMLLFGSLAVRKPVRDLLSRSLAASLSEIE